MIRWLALFLRAWLITGSRWQPDLRHLTFGVLLGGAVLAFAWVTAQFTEGNTHRVRRVGEVALAEGCSLCGNGAYVTH